MRGRWSRQRVHRVRLVGHGRLAEWLKVGPVQPVHVDDIIIERAKAKRERRRKRNIEVWTKEGVFNEVPAVGDPAVHPVHSGSGEGRRQEGTEAVGPEGLI